MYLNKSNQTMQDKYPHLSKIWQDSIAEAFIDFARAENLSFWRVSQENFIKDRISTNGQKRIYSASITA